MVKLTEAENLAALKAAKARGARVCGQLDTESAKIVAEEQAKMLAKRPGVKMTAAEAATEESMRSAGELAQEAAANGEADEPMGQPIAGGGA